MPAHSRKRSRSFVDQRQTWTKSNQHMLARFWIDWHRSSSDAECRTILQTYIPPKVQMQPPPAKAARAAGSQMRAPQIQKNRARTQTDGTIPAAHTRRRRQQWGIRVSNEKARPHRLWHRGKPRLRHARHRGVGLGRGKLHFFRVFAHARDL